MTEETKFFIDACEKGIISVVTALINDPKVDITHGNQRALQSACLKGRDEVIEILLKDSRVDPTVRDNICIQCAAKSGHIKAVSLLLKDPRCDPSTDSQFSLRWSVFNGHLEIAKLLLTHPKVSLDEAVKISEKKNDSANQKKLIDFRNSILPKPDIDPKQQLIIDTLKTVTDALLKLTVELSK